jgi:hypothetical protein
MIILDFRKQKIFEFVFWVVTLCSVVSCHNNTQCHNPDDLNLNFHRHENLNFCMWNCASSKCLGRTLTKVRLKELHV